MVNLKANNSQRRLYCIESVVSGQEAASVSGLGKVLDKGPLRDRVSQSTTQVWPAAKHPALFEWSPLARTSLPA